jgi:Mg-chelatase subunit ChlD
MNQKSFILLAFIGISFVILLSSYRKKINELVNPIHSQQNQDFPQPNSKPETNQQPKIQVVFALDATGSMSGLINAAKEKIWGIASSMTQSDEAPQIEVGLLFYRDRGDEFITSMVPLSQNLDDVYEKLMQIDAGGGGDEPESVNQALYESITKFKWETNQRNTYKSVFLVGDCPPHMDYANDVPYPSSCEKAKAADIFLNTILMGSNSEAEEVWRNIANYNQGSFTKVDMNVNDIAVATPYDEEISKLSDKIDDMRYYYGNEKVKQSSAEKKLKSVGISKYAAPSAKAQRAEYNSTISGNSAYIGNNELLNDIKENKIQLEAISDEELPSELKSIPKTERKKYIEAKNIEKEETTKKLTETIQKRNLFIANELKKKGTDSVNQSFSNVIYDKIKTQSSKKNIQLKGKAKF